MSESEFGRGYATCLIQFANHRARLAEDVESYTQYERKHPGIFGPVRGVTIWASGASDHLYDLTRPKRGVSAADWKAARTLADRALDIGHGFDDTAQPEEALGWLAEADRLLASTGVTSLDAALEWDRSHGLEPERGQRSCATNLSRMVPA